MYITHDKRWGIIDGLDYNTRKALAQKLNTTTKIIGDRLKFQPTRHALDVLVAAKAEFAPTCRTVWGHFYIDGKTRAPDDFQFKTEPYAHQRDALGTILNKRNYFLAWEMGLGKTKTGLDVLAASFLKNEIDGALILTLKGVHMNWIDLEIPKHLALTENQYCAAAWNPQRVDSNMRPVLEPIDGKCRIASMNFNALATKKGTEFAKRYLLSGRMLLIIDESHCLKSPTSKRTKAVIGTKRVPGLASMATRRILMTGTPITGSPLDVWAQYQALDPSILNMDFHKFKTIHSIEEPIGNLTHRVWETPPEGGRPRPVQKPITKVVGYKRLDELQAALDPHTSRLLKSDVLDLPEKIYRRRSFVMPPDVRKVYVRMKDEFRAELDENEFSVQLALTRIQKLQQIACGFLNDEEGNPHEICKTNTRLETLLNILEQTTGGVVIWSQFRHCQKNILSLIREKFGAETVTTLLGDDDQERRMKNMAIFQDPGSKVRFLVGSQSVGGTGFNLTFANDVIYHDNSYALGIRLQSEDRCHRIGQDGTVTYTDIECLGSLDREILDVLQNKLDIASVVSGDELRRWLD